MIIVLMILVGFGLIVYSMIYILKEPNNFQDILKDEKESSEPWQVEIGRIRSEFAITLSEMQSEILRMSDEIDELKNNNKKFILNHVQNENMPVDPNKKENYEVTRVGKNKIDRNKLKKMYKKEENMVETIKEVEKSTISEEKKETKAILIEEVRAFIKEGYSLEEISEKLNIGKGEVLLIRQLYIN